MNTTKGKQLALIFFNKKICAGDRWTCNVCNALMPQAFNGYTNLYHHVNLHREDMIAERLSKNTQRPRNCFQALSFPPEAQSAFAWLKCVTIPLQPSSFFKQNFFSNHFRLSTISVDLLTRYMSTLTTVVEEKVKSVLPDSFAIILDGWSSGDTHYVSVFASFQVDGRRGFYSVFLAMTTIGDEESFSAKEHYEFFLNHFVCLWKVYWEWWGPHRGRQNTNRAFARRIGSFFVGCHSHRLNLVVIDIPATFDIILEKILHFVKTLSIEIVAAKLCKLTHLCPRLRNDTRWSSIFSTVDRYRRLRKFPLQIDSPDEPEFYLDDENDKELDRLFRILGDLDSVTKALQSPDVSLANAPSFWWSYKEIHLNACAL